MKMIDLVFLPIIILMTIIIKYDLLGLTYKEYTLIAYGISLVYILARGEKFKKWIVSEYPEVAEAKDGFNHANMLGILFILKHNDGDRRLHLLKYEHIVLCLLSFFWAGIGAYIIAALL